MAAFRGVVQVLEVFVFLYFNKDFQSHAVDCQWVTSPLCWFPLLCFCSQVLVRFTGCCLWFVAGPMPVMLWRFSVFLFSCQQHAMIWIWAPQTWACCQRAFSSVNHLVEPVDKMKEPFIRSCLFDNGATGWRKNVNLQSTDFIWRALLWAADWNRWTDPENQLFPRCSGMMVGGYMWGYLADQRGRRRVLVVSLTINGLFGGLASLAPWFWLFLLMRFISGIGWEFSFLFFLCSLSCFASTQ